MRKDPRVRLGLQAMAFHMKGLMVTRGECQALEDAALACIGLALDDDYLELQAAALVAATSDPYTEDMAERLRRALAVIGIRARKMPHEYDWQNRKDIAG